AVPPESRADGVATPIAGPELVLTMNLRLAGRRLILVVCQAGFAIAPVRPETVCADAEVNVADPKLASGSVWQLLALTHSEGASAIHSAEVRSSAEARSVFWNPCPLVTSLSVSVTDRPLTLTAACMTSPGRTASRAG